MGITPLRGAPFPIKTAKLQIFRQLTPYYIMKKGSTRIWVPPCRDVYFLIISIPFSLQSCLERLPC